MLVIVIIIVIDRSDHEHDYDQGARGIIWLRLLRCEFSGLEFGERVLDWVLLLVKVDV